MKMHFFTEVSPLGAFSYLPDEIRLMIWKELLPERRPSDESYPRKRCLGILATSRQVYREIRRELYTNRIITFHISPNSERVSGKPSCELSTINISDQLGSHWCLHPRYHKSRKHQDPNMSSWEQLPYRKLKGVNFELLATDPGNPGELLQMWNKLCWLLDMMRHVKGFPKVEIRVAESPVRKWCVNGELTHSLPQAPLQLRQKSSDLEILLSPLRRLRHVQQIELKLPFPPKPNPLDPFISEISLHVVSQEPFGCQTGEEEDMTDILIAIEQDTWTVWLDLLLDTLPGPSAQDAHTDRLRNWSIHYESTMWMRICSYPDDAGEQQLGGAALLTSVEERRVVCAFHDRLLAFETRAGVCAI